MLIRPAQKSDYIQVAPLIVQAMEDLAMKFTQSSDLEKSIPVFEYFFQQKGNQYSYENTLVFEENGEIIGSITGYDGNKLNELRTPFLDHLLEKFRFEQIPEDETEAGEFYIDTVSVSMNHQGKGIGRKLIEAMIIHAKEKGFYKVGLLVDVENPSAKKLYERIGFKIIKTKNLMGGQYEHLVFTVK
ncbi:GNAT family N-acetyltransferase [Moheibacter sediminis]|uniref:Acetyltransferase (GNAT) family protein n=1 Tax=Moheibacter sediminis TaxID=1434700 RepID=A0A1W1YIW6_9FLAO|nr:GNAT family N-acetyltransferase [Moheibacter sediminis]SMC35688.1 Acetyltransferase (GNAT) family protein [Moheibacter sediminis]